MKNSDGASTPLISKLTKNFSSKTVIVIFWFAICGVAGIYLNLQHDIAFNSYNHATQINQLFLSNDVPQGHWRVDHFLAGDCGCSKIVYQSLLKRGAQTEGTTERVVLLHPQGDWEQKLKSRGFQVAAVQDDLSSLKGLGLEDLGVPFFSVYSPKKEEVYVGGYSERTVQENSAIRDVEVLEHYKNGRSMASFPIFGCAVSTKYRKLLDPFGLKYATSKEGEVKF